LRAHLHPSYYARTISYYPYLLRLTHKSEHSERKIATTTSNIVFANSSIWSFIVVCIPVSIVHALPYNSTYRFYLSVKLSCPPCLWVADFFELPWFNSNFLCTTVVGAYFFCFLYAIVQMDVFLRTTFNFKMFHKFEHLT